MRFDANHHPKWPSPGLQLVRARGQSSPRSAPCLFGSESERESRFMEASKLVAGTFVLAADTIARESGGRQPRACAEPRQLCLPTNPAAYHCHRSRSKPQQP